MPLLLRESAPATQSSFAASDCRRRVEPTSLLWRQLFVEHGVPRHGTIVEVAPGYEPKVGLALALLGFQGTLLVVEPDPRAARHILAAYQELLPRATVRCVSKPLEHIRAGDDVPSGIDALVASHPFDDMVMASLVPTASFFSDERDGGSKPSTPRGDVYGALTDEDYAKGVQSVVAVWKRAIQTIAPGLVIMSQYPSRTLAQKKLYQRQQSGFAVLEQLREFYGAFLVPTTNRPSFEYKGNPCWWLIVRPPSRNTVPDVLQLPAAIGRLGASLFVPEPARLLRPDEYDIVYGDRAVIADADIRNFAIALDRKAPMGCKVTAYADRQKDSSGIALSGNFGSGRAVYVGKRCNVLGVGKTTLCRSKVNSHRTGRLELISAMRRVILSRWINRFTDRAPAHAALIALKDAVRVKWNQFPVPLALLVRLDDGDLDRPSHVEQLPDIPVDFNRLIHEYAKLDAECFAYRLLVGAWSNSNYSLNGRVIDLETAAFTPYRGPYFTATAKYPHNRFGYEGFGLLTVLRQLAHVKKMPTRDIWSDFYRERRKHLGFCLLLLLGIEREKVVGFCADNERRVLAIADEFERLAKKIATPFAPFNLYEPRADVADPTLLDASNLFRNIAELYGRPHAVENALTCLIRPTALRSINLDTRLRSRNRAGEFLARHAAVSPGDYGRFLDDATIFARSIFDLLTRLDVGGLLDKKDRWDERLHIMNQPLPTMYELNATLMGLAESYRRGRLTASALRSRIDALSQTP